MATWRCVLYLYGLQSGRHPEVPMQFSEWVRSQPGTQADVASRLGITRCAVSRIMSGRTFPRQSTRAAIHRETQGKVTTQDLVDAHGRFHA